MVAETCCTEGGSRADGPRRGRPEGFPRADKHYPIGYTNPQTDRRCCSTEVFQDRLTLDAGRTRNHVRLANIEFHFGKLFRRVGFSPDTVISYGF